MGIWPWEWGYDALSGAFENALGTIGVMVLGIFLGILSIMVFIGRIPTPWGPAGRWVFGLLLLGIAGFLLLGGAGGML